MLSISSSVTHFFPLNRIPIQLSHKTINTKSDGMINSPLKSNLSRNVYKSLDDGLIRGMWYEGSSFVVILVEVVVIVSVTVVCRGVWQLVFEARFIDLVRWCIIVCVNAEFLGHVGIFVQYHLLSSE